MTHGGLPELHLHLDGSLRADTLRELAAPLGLHVPDELRFHQGMTLRQALDRFRLTLAVLQTPQAVGRVADEICQDAAQNGVTTLEIRFAPHLHHGAPMEDIIDAAIEGCAGRAGIILCGLYGDDPGIFADFTRAAHTRRAIVGIDLAGAPQPNDPWTLRDYKQAFGAARQAGLGLTVHAGEGRPADEIRTAIEVLGATRIGHACSIMDDPELVELAIQKGVTIESCPTSNVQTSAVASLKAHPVVDWLRAGLKVTLCADNTLFSDTTAAEEFDRVAEHLPLTPDDRLALIQHGHQAAFVRH